MSDVDFGLSDDEFWSNPGKEPPRRGPLPSIPATSGLELAAPSFASVTGRETLPLVARFTATHEELARVSFARSALITVVDLDRNSFYCGFACDQEEAVTGPPPGAALTRPRPPGRMSRRFVIDLRARAQIPWQPSELLVTALLEGQPSNRVRTRVGKPPDAYIDPAVERYLESRSGRPAAHGPSPQPGRPYPSYSKTAESPIAPRPTGIALTAELPKLLRSGSRCPLRGSFRLPVRPEERVSAAAAEAFAAQARSFDLGPPDGELTAVVAVHLVITGIRRPAPRWFTLAVPIFGPLDERSDPPIGAGHFALDLFAPQGEPWEPDTYLVHAWSREALCGPISLVVRAEMIERRL
ncbi:MAG: hypothetical protein IT349_03165 [Candidatus Eisenbacteria bacterium]|nr:hypothetical protein [Candidatus Eisenbacteria bacterium]